MSNNNIVNISKRRCKIGKVTKRFEVQEKEPSRAEEIAWEVMMKTHNDPQLMYEIGSLLIEVAERDVAEALTSDPDDQYNPDWIELMGA